MIGDIEALNEELDHLRRKSQLLESLMRLAQLSDVEEADILQEALDIVAALTESETAFVFTLNGPDGTLNPGVWGDGSGGEQQPIPLAEAGTWARAADSDEMLVAGEGPLDDAATRGLGYKTPILRFVSTPIVVQGEVVAVAGVLNKESPYGENDRLRVSMLMHSMWAILQHKRAQQVLRGITLNDQLTGLANRDRFDQVLRIEVRRADRAGVPLAVVTADIDGFTAYNAVRGRADGDRALTMIAGALQESFQRAGELVARMGDDLFAMVLPATAIADAGKVGERAREAVEFLSIPHPSSDTSDHITVSVGIAVHEPRSGGSADALLATALEGMEESRKAGGNLVGSPLPQL